MVPIRRAFVESQDRHAMGEASTLGAIGRLDVAGSEMRSMIAAAHPSRWWDTTPCDGWSVRDVVNHVVTGNLRTLAWTLGETGQPNEQDLVAGDPLGAFDSSLAGLRGALVDAFRRQAPIPAPFAVLDAEQVVDMRCNELVVHAWDVARTIDRPTSFVPDLCDRLLEIARARIGMADRAGSPFGPEQSVPADASAADRLAAFLGRRL